MSYNLLLDTNFQKLNQRWKLTNCQYKDGYLIGNSKIYSIEQTITLPNPTKLYFSLDYINFDSNIQNVWVGIQSKDVLESNKKQVKNHKRVRLSVIDDIKIETIKVIFIVEAKTESSKIYIDSPLLIDLIYQHKGGWLKYFLDKFLHYKHGYCYSNIYKQNEITLDNEDFYSVNQSEEQGNVGILTTLKQPRDWFDISCNLCKGSYYLAKLDYEEVNQYGQIYFKYGEYMSENIDDNQLYIIFRADGNTLKIMMENDSELNYCVNLKHLLVIKLDNMNIDIKDMPHIPFIEN